MIRNTEHPPYEHPTDPCPHCGKNKARMGWRSRLSRYYKGWCSECHKRNSERRRLEYGWQGEEMFDGGLKECPTCHQQYIKTREHWSKNTSNLDGVYSICLHCTVTTKYGLNSCLERENIRKFQNNSCPACVEKGTLPINGGACIDHDYKVIPYGSIDPRWKSLSTEFKRSSLRGLLCSSHNKMFGHIDAFFADQELQNRYWAYVKNPPAQEYFRNNP